MNSPHTAVHNTFGLQRKITTVIWVLRSLALVYTLWVLQHISGPVLDSADFLQKVGRYWNKDLLSAATWQLWAAIALNFVLWLGLALAVACFWQASVHLLRDMGVSSPCGKCLRWGAWCGLCAALLSIATRPVWSYLLTLHLEKPLLQWQVLPTDLLGLMVCGALLLLSYLVIWISEIAEENKAFV